jgi:hypothetical protein
MANKKRKRVRVPRQIARNAWERGGAGPHVDKKKRAKETACRDWDLNEELDN